MIYFFFIRRAREVHDFPLVVHLSVLKLLLTFQQPFYLFYLDAV